ncbi:MAG: L-threonylcarbamoyladenylate synthase [Candidatus Hadarchaeales archaeon]
MVRVLRLGSGKDRGAILEAAGVLRSGGLVIYPTETVYGLGGDARSDTAVRKVFDAKGRKFDSPMSIALSSAGLVEKFAHLPPEARGILKLLPGPLTIVLKAKGGLSRQIVSRSGTIGIRVPAQKVALSLIEAAGFPITSTSANVSGNPPPLTVDDALEQIGDRVDLALDAGRCEGGIPSTVVDLTVKPFRILRKGPVGREEIEKAMGLSG